MFRNCAHCGGGRTQAGADCIQCLECGLLTHVSGRAVPPEPEQYEDSQRRIAEINARREKER